MPKRCLCLLLCLALALGLSGCASMLKGDYLVVQAHKETADVGSDSDEPPEVGTYLTLKAAILDLVLDGREYGVIRLSDFTTDEMEAMSMACWEVKSTSAFGAFAVDHISYEYTKVLSYYDMEVYISYRRTQAQIDGLLVLSTPSLVRAALRNVVRGGGGYIAISVSDASIDEKFMGDYIEEYYYSNPMYILSCPTVEINGYPDTGVKRIIEVFFNYPFESEEMSQMTIDLNQAGRSMLNDIMWNGDDPTYALDICRALDARCEYADTGEIDRAKPESMAYGALMDGLANSEGYAMAYKLLCDIAGIECEFVLGRLDGAEHAWNIIRLGDQYYHVDPSACDTEGYYEAFLRSDDEMWSRYWWDSEEYSVCEGALSYAALIGEPEPEVEEPPAEPTEEVPPTSEPEEEIPEDGA